MLIDVITLVIAYALCFGLGALVKRYTEVHCKDNKPIVWIWLDDEDVPKKGTKVPAADRPVRLQVCFQ